MAINGNNKCGAKFPKSCHFRDHHDDNIGVDLKK